MCKVRSMIACVRMRAGWLAPHARATRYTEVSMASRPHIICKNHSINTKVSNECAQLSTCEHIRRVLMLVSPRLLAAPLASTSFECPLLLEEHLRLSVQLFIGLFLTLSQLLHPRAPAQQHIRGRKNHPRRGAFRRAGSLNVSMQMRERYHSSFSIPHLDESMRFV